MAVKDNLGGGLKVNGFDYTLPTATAIESGEPVVFNSNHVSVVDAIVPYPGSEKPLAFVSIMERYILCIYPGTNAGCIRASILYFNRDTLSFSVRYTQDNIQLTSTSGVIFGSAKALYLTNTNSKHYVAITVKDKRTNSSSVNNTYNTMYVTVLQIAGNIYNTVSISRSHPVYTYPLQTSQIQNFYPQKICGSSTEIMVVWNGLYTSGNTWTRYVAAFAFTISYASGSESITEHGKATTAIATGGIGNEIYVYSSPYSPARCTFIVTPNYTSSSTDYDTCHVYSIIIANFTGTFTATASNLWTTSERANFSTHYGMPNGSIIISKGGSKPYFVINSSGALIGSALTSPPDFLLNLQFANATCAVTISLNNFTKWKATAWSEEGKRNIIGLTYEQTMSHGIKDHYVGVYKPIQRLTDQMFVFYDSSDMTKIKQIIFPLSATLMTSSTSLESNTSIGICKNSKQVRIIK